MATNSDAQEKQEKERNLEFQKIVIQRLAASEKHNRTLKDQTFKQREMDVKNSGLLKSSDTTTVKIAESLTEINSNANDQNLKVLSSQRENLKILRKSLDAVSDPDEKAKLEKLISVTEQSVKQYSGATAKFGDIVGDALVVSSGIFAAVLSDSPLLGLGVALVGKQIKDGIEARRERSKDVADQTEAFRQSLEDNLPDPDLPERISEGMSEEEKREDAVLRAEELSLLERQADALEMMAGKDGDGEESSGLGLSLAAGAAGLGAMLLTSIKGAFVGFAVAFKKFVMKTLPRFLARINPVVLIVGTLMTGIDDAWNEYMESGSILKALIAGFSGIIEFLTFGLIDVDTIKSFLTPIVDSIIAPFKLISELWDSASMTDMLTSGIENLKAIISFVFNLPSMLLNKLSDIGGSVADAVGDFFNFDSEEPAIEPAQTQRQASILKPLIENKEERESPTQSGAAATSKQGSGSTTVVAPVTNNQSSSSVVYNNMSASNARRIVTQ